MKNNYPVLGTKINITADSINGDNLIIKGSKTGDPEDITRLMFYYLSANRHELVRMLKLILEAAYGGNDNE